MVGDHLQITKGSTVTVIGVFLNSSKVAIGDIAGSGSINILFILGACTLVSSGTKDKDGNPIVLNLTWFPLLRDVFFNLISLLGLFLIFKTGTTKTSAIQLWEAFYMLLIYIAYHTFMMFNDEIEAKFTTDEPGAEEEVSLRIETIENRCKDEPEAVKSKDEPEAEEDVHLQIETVENRCKDEPEAVKSTDEPEAEEDVPLQIETAENRCKDEPEVEESIMSKTEIKDFKKAIPTMESDTIEGSEMDVLKIKDVDDLAPCFASRDREINEDALRGL